jgi:hypothetical protein
MNSETNDLLFALLAAKVINYHQLSEIQDKLLEFSNAREERQSKLENDFFMSEHGY